METADQLAPPVVAVMVVDQPDGEGRGWFEESLAALSAQDYPNLRHLFLLTSETGEEVAALIRSRLPGAFVRTLPGNPGFGPAANEVLRLVEGDNGFFCILHDDVALDRSAVRLLVEELYRSNAGIVGPKLVEWDNPGLLQHVGLAVDHYGEVDPVVEPGEADQEQHDAVQDRFALPSACLLVRADLFRAVGGFDESIEYYGDDVDLCWRAHLTGARVVVVPAARARHREELVERRPDLNHLTLLHRNRVRTVVTLTGARRLPLLSLQLVLVTLAEAVVGVFTGRFRSAWASLRALVGLVPRTPAIVARRRALRALRDVPDNEVSDLQERGSARLKSYLRSRATRPLDPEESSERRWRETAGSLPVIAWLTLLAMVVVGSRSLITHGVPQIGQFLPYPHSPRGMLADFRSGWDGQGLGSATANPTGLALIALGSTITVFHMGLWHTVAVIGLLVVGYLGMWRLVTLFPMPRARIAALAVYALVPLPSELLSAGRWSALACYAATPWCVHLLRRIAGIEGAGAAAADEVEREIDVPPRRRIRLVAQLTLLTAVTFAFAPGFALVLVLIGIVLAITTALARGSLLAALLMVGAAVVAAFVALLINLPWASTLFGRDGWNVVAGVPPLGPHSEGLSRLARFGVGTGQLGVVAVVLYVPVIVAPLVARSWRLTWAIRAVGLVVAFGWLALLDDRGVLGWRLPEPGIMLAPVALGTALAAACLAAAFDSDVLGGSFGWRQPLALLAGLCVVLGLVPGLYAVADGRWNMPTLTLSELIPSAANPPEGDSRTLWLGDERVLPVQGWALRPGISYAITDDGPNDVTDSFAGRPSSAERQVAEIVNTMSTETTLRVGRLLAPFAIRYIIVPMPGEGLGKLGASVPVPPGLIDALDDQLDLGRPLSTSLNFVVYENHAWVPTRSELTPVGAAASHSTSVEARSSVDLAGATPLAVGAPDRGPAQFSVEPGTVHLAVPAGTDWRLHVDGAAVPRRTAFGVTTAFDAPSAGTAQLTFATPASRGVGLTLEAVAWLLLALAASRFDPSRYLPTRRLVVADPIIEIKEPIPDPADTADAGELPWDDELAWDGDDVVTPGDGTDERGVPS